MAAQQHCLHALKQVIQNRNDHECQGLPGLLRTCAGVAEKIALIDNIKKQPVCRLSRNPEPLPLVRPIGKNDFILGKLPHSPIRSQDDVSGEYVTQCRC